MRHKTDTVALKVLFTIGVSLLTLGTSITSQAAEEKTLQIVWIFKIFMD